MYEYDALYRLIKAQGRELTNLTMATESDFVNTLSVPNAGSNAMQNYTQMFSYDELGNLQTMQSQGRWSRSYIYDNVTNQLLRHEGTNNVYTYDAHGNMTSMPHLSSMTWNSSDMLRSATNGTLTSYYSYNAAGDRVRKVVEKGNIREERLYQGNYERYRKYVNNILKTERQTLHIIDDRHRFALIDRLTIDNGITLSTATSSVRYQYDNHLGSASLELDQTAAIISYEEYHPFGTTSYRSGRTETEVSQKRYKYVGKERDEETGLYYYGARYYAAWIGRWISVDPLKEERRWLTPYNYCQNNPMLRLDPTGALDGDYYKLDAKGNPVFDHSDNKNDGNVYIDRGDGNYYLLPSFSDRQYIKDRVTEHLSNGPTFNEIGGEIRKITEYDLANIGDSSKDTVFTKNYDFPPGDPFLPDSSEALIEKISSESYKAPEGKYSNEEVTHTWHDHPTGGYYESPLGTYQYTKSADGRVRNMARETAENAMKANFYVVGKEGPTPGI